MLCARLSYVLRRCGSLSCADPRRTQRAGHGRAAFLSNSRQHNYAGKVRQPLPHRTTEPAPAVHPRQCERTNVRRNQAIENRKSKMLAGRPTVTFACSASGLSRSRRGSLVSTLMMLRHMTPGPQTD